MTPTSVSDTSVIAHQQLSQFLSTLPTKKYTSEKIPKWSARAIRSFGLGELEARKLKYPNTGTEALLMGILIEGTSPAAKFLRANGITFFKVREETVNLLGKSEIYLLELDDVQLCDSGEITTTHILLGIWSEKESAGRRILETLGFNDDKAKEVIESMNRDVALSSSSQKIHTQVVGSRWNKFVIKELDPCTGCFNFLNQMLS
ncbi:hypothetical protein OIU76_000159 [Salix suchowensis]|nr:hypothetical protein OIU76_000159 [Salix suchowensis]